MGLIRELLLSFSSNWLLYTSWQFYLVTLMWRLPEPEDDPPDGGIGQGVASATPLLS